MINTFTQRVCATLLGVVILSACSRPVAYFQRSPAEPSVKTLTAIATEPALAATAPTELLAKANATMAQLNSYVQNDSKLTTNKKLTERINRVRRLLASTHGTVEATTVSAPQTTTTMMERLMLKKINKQINRQLAPNHTEKTTTTSPVILIGGIVLLIGGLILLIAGTGTAAFIGLILALIGALGTVLGLFGQ